MTGVLADCGASLPRYSDLPIQKDREKDRNALDRQIQEALSQGFPNHMLRCPRGTCQGIVGCLLPSREPVPRSSK